MKVESVIPILRIFSEEKAREFYVDYLGFKVDWEHRFEPGTPLYLQISRDGITLHLSEHHGDGTPGSYVFIKMSGLEDVHRELSGKNYKYLRPDIQDVPWNARQLSVIDPFGNRLNFNEFKEAA